MNIVRKDVDAINTTIGIQISKVDYEEKAEKQLKEYRKKANIPGFRPGMVPIGLIKKMYGKAIMAEEINKIISDSLMNYIKENNLDILGEPLPNETDQKPINFDTDEEFEFLFDLALAPEFDIELSKKDKVKYYDITVTDEMIDNQIKSYAGRFGKYEQKDTAEEKDMLKGELIELNADKKPKTDGIHVTDAVLSADRMIDAQKALFVNAKKGDTIIFNPKEAFNSSDIEISSLMKISKEATKNLTSDFSFTIQSITRYAEADIDQSLFDKVLGEGKVKDEAEFRAKVAEGIKDSYIADSEYKFGMDTKDAILKKIENVVFPEAFLKRWVLTTNTNLTKETVEKDFHLMLDDLKWYLVKNKLAKKYECKVEKDDINAYAKKIAKIQFAQYGMINVPDDILENYAQETLKKEDAVKNMIEKIIEEKVLAKVKEAIKLDTKAISYEDFNKMFEEK